MSTFYQKYTLSYDEAQKKLNEHLSGLEIIAVQNSTSDTRRLFITVFSKKHDANYYLSIGTDNWTWKDKNGLEIPVFKDEYIVDHYHMLAITNAVKNLIEENLTIKKIEVSEKSKIFKIFFEDGSILQAQEDTTSEDPTFYQLILEANTLYQNYNLVTQNDAWFEEITNGEEYGPYKAALFDLDYFRTEHRNFTIHAIHQARKSVIPVSFIQAKVLYLALTTASEFSFSPWIVGRSSVDRTRLETIPEKELVELTKDECKKNNFSVEEAEDILKSTIDSLREWVKTEKNLEIIARQEYVKQDFFEGLIQWYEETF